MKKSIILLTVTLLILGVLFMIIFASQNIKSAISLTQNSRTEENSLCLDINTATARQLAFVPGIGNSLAVKIVEHRRQYGPYQSVEDLLRVNGIGAITYAKIADYLTVGG